MDVPPEEIPETFPALGREWIDDLCWLDDLKREAEEAQQPAGRVKRDGPGIDLDAIERELMEEEEVY